MFGCQAPDSGNAEILAHFGTDEQKATYLQPLLDGKISSTYAMTEPQGGADPFNFTCSAVRDGDEWVINGQKWFASNYTMASFVIAMVITDPDVPVHRGASMILVPMGTPGMDLIRGVGVGPDEGIGEGSHGYVQFTDCRVPADNLLGEEGSGFQIAQTRLGGGRLHHAMRTVGLCKAALDMMGERIVSRRTKGAPLADQQSVRHTFADSWIQLEQFRLQVLHAAWQCDQHGYDQAREYIAGIKVATPKTMMDIAYRALHLHGSLGASNEMPFHRMMLSGHLARPRRRPDRGAQGQPGPQAAEGRTGRRRVCSPPPTSRPASTPPARSTPSTSSGSSPTPEPRPWHATEGRRPRSGDRRQVSGSANRSTLSARAVAIWVDCTATVSK